MTRTGPYPFIPLHFGPILIPAWANRLYMLRTMVLSHRNDTEGPQTRGIDQNVPWGAPETHPTALLRLSAAQTAPGASQQFWFFYVDYLKI